MDEQHRSEEPARETFDEQVGDVDARSDTAGVNGAVDNCNKTPDDDEGSIFPTENTTEVEYSKKEDYGPQDHLDPFLNQIAVLRQYQNRFDDGEHKLRYNLHQDSLTGFAYTVSLHEQHSIDQGFVTKHIKDSSVNVIDAVKQHQRLTTDAVDYPQESATKTTDAVEKRRKCHTSASDALDEHEESPIRNSNAAEAHQQFLVKEEDVATNTFNELHSNVVDVFEKFRASLTDVAIAGDGPQMSPTEDANDVEKQQVSASKEDDIVIVHQKSPIIAADIIYEDQASPIKIVDAAGKHQESATKDADDVEKHRKSFTIATNTLDEQEKAFTKEAGAVKEHQVPFTVVSIAVAVSQVSPIKDDDTARDHQDSVTRVTDYVKEYRKSPTIAAENVADQEASPIKIADAAGKHHEAFTKGANVVDERQKSPTTAANTVEEHEESSTITDDALSCRQGFPTDVTGAVEQHQDFSTGIAATDKQHQESSYAESGEVEQLQHSSTNSAVAVDHDRKIPINAADLVEQYPINQLSTDNVKTTYRKLNSFPVGARDVEENYHRQSTHKRSREQNTRTPEGSKKLCSRSHINSDSRSSSSRLLHGGMDSVKLERAGLSSSTAGDHIQSSIIGMSIRAGRDVGLLTEEEGQIMRMEYECRWDRLIEIRRKREDRKYTGEKEDEEEEKERLAFEMRRKDHVQLLFEYLRRRNIMKKEENKKTLGEEILSLEEQKQIYERNYYEPMKQIERTLETMPMKAELTLLAEVVKKFEDSVEEQKEFEVDLLTVSKHPSCTKCDIARIAFNRIDYRSLLLNSNPNFATIAFKILGIPAEFLFDSVKSLADARKKVYVPEQYMQLIENIASCYRFKKRDFEETWTFVSTAEMLLHDIPYEMRTRFDLSIKDPNLPLASQKFVHQSRSVRAAQLKPFDIYSKFWKLDQFHLISNQSGLPECQKVLNLPNKSFSAFWKLIDTCERCGKGEKQKDEFNEQILTHIQNNPDLPNQSRDWCFVTLAACYAFFSEARIKRVAFEDNKQIEYSQRGKNSLRAVANQLILITSYFYEANKCPRNLSTLLQYNGFKQILNSLSTFLRMAYGLISNLHVAEILKPKATIHDAMEFVFVEIGHELERMMVHRFQVSPHDAVRMRYSQYFTLIRLTENTTSFRSVDEEEEKFEKIVQWRRTVLFQHPQKIQDVLNDLVTRPLDQPFGQQTGTDHIENGALKNEVQESMEIDCAKCVVALPKDVGIDFDERLSNRKRFRSVQPDNHGRGGPTDDLDDGNDQPSRKRLRKMVSKQDEQTTENDLSTSLRHQLMRIFSARKTRSRSAEAKFIRKEPLCAKFLKRCHSTMDFNDLTKHATKKTQLTKKTICANMTVDDIFKRPFRDEDLMNPHSLFNGIQNATDIQKYRVIASMLDTTGDEGKENETSNCKSFFKCISIAYRNKGLLNLVGEPISPTSVHDISKPFGEKKTSNVLDLHRRFVQFKKQQVEDDKRRMMDYFQRIKLCASEDWLKPLLDCYEKIFNFNLYLIDHYLDLVGSRVFNSYAVYQAEKDQSTDFIEKGIQKIMDQTPSVVNAYLNNKPLRRQISDLEAISSKCSNEKMECYIASLCRYACYQIRVSQTAEAELDKFIWVNSTAPHKDNMKVSKISVKKTTPPNINETEYLEKAANREFNSGLLQRQATSFLAPKRSIAGSIFLAFFQQSQNFYESIEVLMPNGRIDPKMKIFYQNQGFQILFSVIFKKTHYPTVEDCQRIGAVHTSILISAIVEPQKSNERSIRLAKDVDDIFLSMSINENPVLPIHPSTMGVSMNCFDKRLVISIVKETKIAVNDMCVLGADDSRFVLLTTRVVSSQGSTIYAIVDKRLETLSMAFFHTDNNYKDDRVEIARLPKDLIAPKIQWDAILDKYFKPKLNCLNKILNKEPLVRSVDILRLGRLERPTERMFPEREREIK